jgi:hypothetical protein
MAKLKAEINRKDAKRAKRGESRGTTFEVPKDFEGRSPLEGSVLGCDAVVGDGYRSGEPRRATKVASVDL